RSMLLAVFSFLLPTTVNCNQLSCLSHFNACSAIITRPVADINAVNSVSVTGFCEDMTNVIIPCIAEKMQVERGDSLYGRAITLVRCYNTTNKGARGVEVERQHFLYVTRLYLYACVYNNMIDMTRPRCLDHVLRNCVETKPNKQECYYWNCALDSGDNGLNKGRRRNAEEMFLSNLSMSHFPTTAFVITLLITRYSF
uniref:Uncharacterized protein n=1 Tax=Parascaris univalens TaxID=6257 RepID=A0A914ZXH3_PARUN